MPGEIGEVPTAPPPEGSKKAPESRVTKPVSNPDQLLDRLQSEAARTIGAGKNGQSGSSHS